MWAPLDFDEPRTLTHFFELAALMCGMGYGAACAVPVATGRDNAAQSDVRPPRIAVFFLIAKGPFRCRERIAAGQCPVSGGGSGQRDRIRAGPNNDNPDDQLRRSVRSAAPGRDP